MNPLGHYRFQNHSGPGASESASLVHAVSSIFSNSFGINSKTQRPYRLGPKTTRKRLAVAHRLFIASDSADQPVGYLFATEIQSSRGTVGWIDSLAVLPQHRRKGVGTRLVENLAEHFERVRWIGCATPNPIAALVISKVVKGELYIGECDPTEELVAMINDIRPFCQDLSGVDFNPSCLLVRTQFHPADTGDNKEWSPPHPTEPPPWWSSLENLSSQYEALLIVDKSHEIMSENKPRDFWQPDFDIDLSQEIVEHQERLPLKPRATFQGQSSARLNEKGILCLEK